MTGNNLLKGGEGTMINFKEEIIKYDTILEIDDIESAIHSGELQDLLDILQHISSKKSEKVIYERRKDADDWKDKE